MKIFEGVVVSTKMNKTIVVEITRRTPHPLYKKLIKRSSKFNVDNTGFENVEVGNKVKIVETRPISKNKYFKILSLIDAKNVKSKVAKKVEDKVEVVTEIKPAKKAVVKKAVSKTTKVKKEAKK